MILIVTGDADGTIQATQGTRPGFWRVLCELDLENL